ncbi:MAG: hypothetical protein F6K35_03780 [Okeania sp. SIO2H7]|nr:hypothetical protein [Okeania sp. SIO2H7]
MLILTGSVAAVVCSQSFQDFWQEAIAPNLPGLPVTSSHPVSQQNIPNAGDFDRAYQIIKEVEGGYSNHPNDGGGQTYRGITKVVAKRYGYDDPRQLSASKIRQIYHKDYWVASGADKQKWPLNLAIFNSYVNSGKKWKVPQSGTPQEKALAYLQQQTNYYQTIVSKRPSQRVFLRGWLNRSDRIKKAILDSR